MSLAVKECGTDRCVSPESTRVALAVFLPKQREWQREVRESKAESLETPEEPQNPEFLIYMANQYFLWFCLKGLREGRWETAPCGRSLRTKNTSKVRGFRSSQRAVSKRWGRREALLFFCNPTIWFKISSLPLWTDSPLGSEFPRKLQCGCHPACFMDFRTNRFLHACL